MLEKGRLQLERTIAMLTIKHWISSKPTQNFSIPPFKGYYKQDSDQNGLYFITSTIRLSLSYRSTGQCEKMVNHTLLYLILGRHENIFMFKGLRPFKSTKQRLNLPSTIQPKKPHHAANLRYNYVLIMINKIIPMRVLFRSIYWLFYS